MLDAAAMGEVLETFIVSSTPIDCITAIPAFDENDPDVLTSQYITVTVCVCNAKDCLCVCTCGFSSMLGNCTLASVGV